MSRSPSTEKTQLRTATALAKQERARRLLRDAVTADRDRIQGERPQESPLARKRSGAMLAEMLGRVVEAFPTAPPPPPRGHLAQLRDIEGRLAQLMPAAAPSTWKRNRRVLLATLRAARSEVRSNIVRARGAR